MTVVLAFLVCINTAWGSIVVLRNREYFAAIDREILFPWLMNVGIKEPSLNAWIFILIILMTLVALNTIVCTADKVSSIIRGSKPKSALFPHIVHVGFLIAMLGHLVGSVYGFRSYENVIFMNEAINVPNTEELVVRLDDFEADISSTGNFKTLETTLTLIDPSDGTELLTKVISLNDPLIHKGIAFYHTNQGRSTTGLILNVDGERREVDFGGGFSVGEEDGFLLGTLFPDYAIDELGNAYSRSSEFRNPYQEIRSLSGERAYLNVSNYGSSVRLSGKTIRLVNYRTTPYVVLTINKDPGIIFIITGSMILVLGMIFLLLFRGNRGELIAKKELSL
jgi:cytochrome c biogenesis protein ResB